MTTEHALRATLTVYVEDEVRYREGIAALDNLLARLRTVEAERDVLHADVIRATGVLREQNEFNARMSADLRAAEARVEAAMPPDPNDASRNWTTVDWRIWARKVRAAYLTTGAPYVDEPESCPSCGGDGWYVGHEDECYDTGDCCCSGVQVPCECVAEKAR